MSTNDESKAAGKTTSRLKSVLVMVAIPAIVVLGLLITRNASPDPIWQGHRLSHYVDQLPVVSVTGTGGGYAVHAIQTNRWIKLSARELLTQWNEHEQGADIPRKAIVKIGADGLPLLMRQLALEESTIELKMSKSPQWLKSLLSKVGIRVSPTRTRLKRWQAVAAMRELHEAGIDLSPVMTYLLNLATNQNPDVQIAATFLVFQIESPQLALQDRTAGKTEMPAALTRGHGQ